MAPWKSRITKSVILAFPPRFGPAAQGKTALKQPGKEIPSWPRPSGPFRPILGLENAFQGLLFAVVP